MYLRIKSNDSHLSHTVNRQIYFCVCEEHGLLFSLCFFTVRNAPYGWKPEWNIKKTKVCCIESSSVLSPFIVSSWGQVINPLCWWVHTLLVDSNSTKKKQGELDCCRRPDWFLQGVEIFFLCMLFLYTEWRNRWIPPFIILPWQLPIKGELHTVFSRNIWLLY